MIKLEPSPTHSAPCPVFSVFQNDAVGGVRPRAVGLRYFNQVMSDWLITWMTSMIFFFLQIWNVPRAPSGWTAALHPRVRRCRRRKRRGGKRKGRWGQGTGPNGSDVRAPAVPLCARCAAYSSTPLPRPKSTTEGKHTSGGCGDLQRLSAQVGSHWFSFYPNNIYFWLLGTQVQLQFQLHRHQRAICPSDN